jgi:hypothetical protein
MEATTQGIMLSTVHRQNAYSETRSASANTRNTCNCQYTTCHNILMDEKRIQLATLSKPVLENNLLLNAYWIISQK